MTTTTARGGQLCRCRVGPAFARAVCRGGQRLSVGADSQAHETQELSTGDTNKAHEVSPAHPTVDGPASMTQHTNLLPIMPPPVAGSPTVRPVSVQDFIACLKLPLEPPLINSPPRLRVSHVQDENLVPRHSDRLAAKTVYRDPKPEKQAKKVMLSMWHPSTSAAWSSPKTPDASIASRFHDTFKEPLSSS